MKRITVLLICLFLTISFIRTSDVAEGADCSDASKIFASSYNIQFFFSSVGEASVTQKVSLKNLVDGCFASEYSLGINSANIKSVSGSDSLGKISTSVSKKEKVSTISAKLNNEVIGKNKTVTFELKYKIEGLASKNGLAWEVLVPGFNTTEEVTGYSLKIVAPAIYGDLVSVNPEPSSVDNGETQTILSYSDKSSLGKTIFANFGAKQQISFKVIGSVESGGLLKNSKTLPLPPDTKSQQIQFTQLEPKPTKYSTDQFGNLMAEFDTGEIQSNQIEVNGIATLTGVKEEEKNQGQDSLNLYTQGGKYIQVNNNLVQQKANDLNSVEDIYNYVTDLLEFDTEAYETGRSSRKTSLEMLRGETKVLAQGYVDLFASLTKAAGIPTKLVYGLVVEEVDSFKPVFVGAPLDTKKIGVWVEIYDKNSKSWTSIDPTLGDVLGIDYIQDNFLDRIALFYSINGDDLDLLTPFGVTDQNVKLEYLDKESISQNNLNLNIEYDQIFAGFPVEVKVIIENKKGNTIQNSTLNIETKNLELIGEKEIKLKKIYPFETKEATLKLRANNLFGQQEGTIEIGLSGEEENVQLTEPKNEKILVNGFFTLGVQQGLLIAIVVLILSGLLFPKLTKFSKKNSRAAKK